MKIKRNYKKEMSNQPYIRTIKSIIRQERIQEELDIYDFDSIYCYVLANFAELYRRAFWHYYIHGMDFKEISEYYACKVTEDEIYKTLKDLITQLYIDRENIKRGALE